jgi:hypothetical protein
MTDENVAKVIELLDSWSTKLTWERLIEALRAEIGITYSRFTLSERPRIAHAFALRKEVLRGTVARGPRTINDGRVLAVLECSGRLKATAERLSAENNLLLEQFITWAVNAERHGVSMDMLNQPLAKPSRERTKGEE